jgi:hypothetical protein
VPQDRLDSFAGYAQLMQIRYEATAGCVPSAPLRQSFLMLEQMALSLVTRDIIQKL